MCVCVCVCMSLINATHRRSMQNKPKQPIEACTTKKAHRTISCNRRRMNETQKQAISITWQTPLYP